MFDMAEVKEGRFCCLQNLLHIYLGGKKRRLRWTKLGFPLQFLLFKMVHRYVCGQLWHREMLLKEAEENSGCQLGAGGMKAVPGLFATKFCWKTCPWGSFMLFGWLCDHLISWHYSTSITDGQRETDMWCSLAKRSVTKTDLVMIAFCFGKLTFFDQKLLCWKVLGHLCCVHFSVV